ncbi:MAG: hypothetical protein ACTSQD_04225 [Promethearchaeota archaeon]|jgi:hypothetical protein
MERQREKTKEESEEVQKAKDNEIELLRNELLRLRELKKQRELKEREEATEKTVDAEQKEIDSEEKDRSNLSNIESRLNEIDQFLLKQFEQIETKTYDPEFIETQLQVLEKEIVGEKGLIEKELTAYEQLLNSYPWLEEERMKFMYSMPNKKKQESDYISWRTEWSKVLFDYSRYAILHIIYIRELVSEQPFSNFTNRELYIKEIAEELIEQEMAQWLSKKKDSLRVYWKTLEVWADEIYDWAYEEGKLEPVMIYELREATSKDFSNLPMEDLEAIFKILAKNRRAKVLKLDDGQLAFKIQLE